MTMHFTTLKANLVRLAAKGPLGLARGLDGTGTVLYLLYWSLVTGQTWLGVLLLLAVGQSHS
jgi:hypothetical protein